MCATYDLPYTTGPLAHQYLQTLRTIFKLALPDRFLTATSDDAPETASENRFRSVAKQSHLWAVGDDSARDTHWVQQHRTDGIGVSGLISEPAPPRPPDGRVHGRPVKAAYQ